MKEELRNKFLKENRRYFELAFETYVGGWSYIAKYLVKWTGEEDSHYLKRLDIAHNINIIDKIINILTSFILGGVERKIDLDPEVRDIYLKSIDLEQSLDEFLERKIAEYLLMDNAFTYVDAFENDRAYCHDINYLDLFDFKKELGRLSFVDIQLGDMVYRITAEDYKHTTRDKYFTTKDKQPSWSNPVANKIKVIPLVRVNAKLDVNTPYFRDAVYDQKAIFNHYNSIDQQLLDTGNTILGIPGNQSTFNPQTSRVLKFQPSSPVLPQFIGPPTEHLDFYLKYIQHIRDELLNSLNIYRESNTDNQASGLSKSYDYSIMANFLVKLSGKIERFEKDIWQMIAKYDSRVNPEKIEVLYSRDFDLRSLADQLDNVLRVSSLQISETLSKEMEKKLASRFVENPDTLKKIWEEIDGKDFSIPVNTEFTGLKPSNNGGA